MSVPRTTAPSVLFTLVMLLVMGLSASVLAGGDEPVDEDGDGYDVSEDCDDQDDDVNPGEDEVCDDGIDNDCDGVDWVAGQDLDGDGESPDADGCDGADCDDEDPVLNSADADADTVTSCNGDCDDTVATGAAASPALDEVCGDGVDNDCSGAADDEDLDSDGSVSLPCDGEDCDDSNATTNPDAGESDATCGDGVDNDCDTFVDELDEDCFQEPEVSAGLDQQARYLGGNQIVVLDGSGTTDGNEADVLTYTWTLNTDPATFPGVTVEFITDPASAYAYLRFHADPGTEATSWDFSATLVVTDGVHTTDADDENATVSAHIYRPTSYSSVGCTVTRAEARVLPLLFALLLILGLRRRQD